MKRGQRQAARSREALKRAFVELMREKGYDGVSVGLVAERADVGRSTFYRHFGGKADVLVAMHEDIFQRLFLSEVEPMDWLADDPSEPLRSFLSSHFRAGGSGMSMARDMGSDADYVMRQVAGMLSGFVARSLGRAFPGAMWTIPMPVLSGAVSGLYVSALVSAVVGSGGGEAGELAVHAHRMVRAVVREGLGRAVE